MTWPFPTQTTFFTDNMAPVPKLSQMVATPTHTMAATHQRPPVKPTHKKSNPPQNKTPHLRTAIFMGAMVNQKKKSNENQSWMFTPTCECHVHGQHELHVLTAAVAQTPGEPTIPQASNAVFAMLKINLLLLGHLWQSKANT